MDGPARRLSRDEHSEIHRRLFAGERGAVAAKALGCPTRSIQRLLARTGGLKARVQARSALRLSGADREELAMPEKLLVVLSITIALVRCNGSSPSAASRAEESVVNTASRSTDASPAPSAPPFVNLPPVGQFRVHPSPDSNEVISIAPGDTVKVNAAHIFDADGDDLTLRVDWGDGQQDKGRCGPCRFAHVYRNLGTFTLMASISDGHLEDESFRSQAKVDHTWTVSVAAPTPPSTPTPPTTCSTPGVTCGAIVIKNAPLSPVSLIGVTITGTQSFGPFTVGPGGSQSISNVLPGVYSTQAGSYYPATTNCPAFPFSVGSGRTVTVTFTQVLLDPALGIIACQVF